MTTYIELPVEEYIKEIAKKAKLQQKVYFSTERNSIKTKVRYDLFLTNGENFSFPTWGQFIECVYGLSREGKEVNFNKTWESFASKHPDDVDKVITVEYYVDEAIQEAVFDVEYVEAKARRNSAAEFKSWLPNYLSQFDDIDYTFEESRSVKNIIKDIKEIVGYVEAEEPATK